MAGLMAERPTVIKKKAWAQQEDEDFFPSDTQSRKG